MTNWQRQWEGDPGKPGEGVAEEAGRSTRGKRDHGWLIHLVDGWEKAEEGPPLSLEDNRHGFRFEGGFQTVNIPNTGFMSLIPKFFFPS